jgi:hypothetical protein
MTFTSIASFIDLLNSIEIEAKKNLTRKEYSRALNKLSKLAFKVSDIMKTEKTYTLTSDDEKVLMSLTSKLVTQD